MSYEAERIAITNYINAQDYYGLTPFGLEGEPENLSNNSGFMVIQSGRAGQVSAGAPSANLHNYTGVLTITIVTEAGSSSAGKAYADAIVDDLTGKIIDETGVQASASSTMTINFSANGQTPYISSSTPESPFHRTVVNAPFIRTERK